MYELEIIMKILHVKKIYLSDASAVSFATF